MRSSPLQFHFSCGSFACAQPSAINLAAGEMPIFIEAGSRWTGITFEPQAAGFMDNTVAKANFPSAAAMLKRYPEVFWHPDVPLFPLAFTLADSRLFRKRWCINRIQRLLPFRKSPFHSLSFSLCLSPFMRVWDCLPAAIMFASASAQPYRADCTTGDRP